MCFYLPKVSPRFKSLALANIFKNPSQENYRGNSMKIISATDWLGKKGCDKTQGSLRYVMIGFA
jgi:hypothetical protein